MANAHDIEVADWYGQRPQARSTPPRLSRQYDPAVTQVERVWSPVITTDDRVKAARVLVTRGADDEVAEALGVLDEVRRVRAEVVAAYVLESTPEALREAEAEAEHIQAAYWEHPGCAPWPA